MPRMQQFPLWSRLAWILAFSFAECRVSNIAADHAGDLLLSTRERAPVLDGIAGNGAAWGLEAPSLGRRDVKYTSGRMSLDTTWKDTVLYQHSFSKPVGKDGNVTLSAGVQIVCKDCYIKGSFLATLTVAGDTDMLELLVDYGKNATADIEKITNGTLGPLEKSLVNGAQAFLKEADAVATVVHDTIEEAYELIIEELGINTTLVRDVVSEAFGAVEDFIENETAEVDRFATNLKDEVENITESAFQDFKNDLENSIGKVPGLGGLADKVENVTETAVDFVKTSLEKEMQKIAKGFNIGSFAFPTINLDFNLPSLPSLPAVGLQFELDDLELYMDLDLVLSAGAAYSLPLFRSKSEVGAGNAQGFAGVVVAVDLLLDVQAQIEISSGFHLRLDDTLSIDLELFSQQVSHLKFPGAQFEFLPVTVTSGNAVIKGALTVTLESGWQMDKQSVVIFDEPVVFGAGVNDKVFANVAYFTTNITATPSEHAGDCELSVEEYFEFNLGAGIGASVVLNNHTWGPSPQTTVPVYYTTLGSVCALTALAESTPTPAAAAQTSAADARARDVLPRQDLVTTTLVSTVVFTALACASSGLINCPASLQITQTSESETSLVTAVASGVTPTFPALSVNSVASRSPFGTNAKSAVAISGTPTPYDPATSASSGASFVDAETGGVSNKVILGVSLGLGVPVLLAAVGAFVWLWRRGGLGGVRYSPVYKQAAALPAPIAYGHDDAGPQEAAKKTPLVSTEPVAGS